VEHLLHSPVDDLAAALADLHGRGIRVAGSEADAPLTARQADLRGPLAIVVGSEGQGLGPTVRKRCDLLMRIPMRGAVGSLNAAVAGSILLFEAVAQRDPDGRHKPLGVTPWPASGRKASAGRAARAGASKDATSPPRDIDRVSPEATRAPSAATTSASGDGAEPADIEAPDGGTDLLPGEPPPVDPVPPKRARSPRKAPTPPET
jgi:hypothetical protein